MSDKLATELQTRADTLIGLASQSNEGGQFRSAEEYARQALSLDSRLLRTATRPEIRIEQRLVLHKILAEALAAQGHVHRALVVVDDGLGLHKANAWYHHVDSDFLELRSVEMLHYGNLCLLKSQLLKQLSEIIRSPALSDQN